MSRVGMLGLLVPALLGAQAAPARLTVRVEADGSPLVRAQVIVAEQMTTTNAAGLARIPLSVGEHVVRVRLIGYKPDSVRVVMPANRDTAITVSLEPAAEQLEQMFVTSMRGVKRLEDEPTRVEVLGGDDVAEKTEMRPQDLRGFLTEMAGVRMQTTSAGTGATGVRLQGLRPRYSLLLADGLPLYGSGGTGLDLMQLPPADLKQIEVVKGPASAIYGASALAGTINLVSKRPGNESDLLLQGTSEAGGNGFGWISNRVSDRFGYTGVVGLHAQDTRDSDADGWAEMPKVKRIEARPRFFFDAPDGMSALVTVGGTFENREGGFADGRAPDGTSYTETAETRRGDLGLTASRAVGSAGVLQMRGSGNFSDMDRGFGADTENVKRHTGLIEVSYALTRARHGLLVGSSLQVDAAKAAGGGPTDPVGGSFDYRFATPALFAQDDWKISDRLSLTASARLDDHSEYGAQFSPRLSALIQPAHEWSIRMSATRGYFAPTPFVEETDPVGAHRVVGFPCGVGSCPAAEHATYASADIHGAIGPFELNGTAFGSRIDHPVLAEPTGTGQLRLVNALEESSSRGVEFFGVYDLEPLFITALYSFTDSRESSDASAAAQIVEAPYAPRHTGGVDITWEAEETGTWIALESFYTSRQRVDDNPYLTNTKPYVLTGILFSQRIGSVKVFANVENLGDVRQTRYSPLVLPARAADGRWTVTPWGPLEGRVFSLGVRTSLGFGSH